MKLLARSLLHSCLCLLFGIHLVSLPPQGMEKHPSFPGTHHTRIHHQHCCHLSVTLQWYHLLWMIAPRHSLPHNHIMLWRNKLSRKKLEYILSYIEIIVITNLENWFCLLEMHNFFQSNEKDGNCQLRTNKTTFCLNEFNLLMKPNTI